MYTLTKLVLNQDHSDDIVHEAIPHTDLVAVAMMEVDGKLRPVREEDLQQMRLTDEEVLEAAQTTIDQKEFRITTIAEMLGIPEQDAPEKGLYVLTTPGSFGGAAVLLRPDVLDAARDQLKDDLVILPSSIHEVLVMKKSEAPDIKDLEMMVREINQHEVMPEDRLSDCVYQYDGHLSMARSQEIAQKETQEKEEERSKAPTEKMPKIGGKHL